MLYLGDWDHQGHQIEANTRRVLERATGRRIEWSRLAITQGQIAEQELTPMWKTDKRYKPAREYEAWEAEALGQGTIQRLVRDALDQLLPEPLEDVRERETVQREQVAAILDALRRRLKRRGRLMRSPDSEPDLAKFQYHLEAAMACSIITCTAWNAEVQRALDAVRDAAPNPPKALVDAAMDAFLAQVADPRPWYEQHDQWWPD